MFPPRPPARASTPHVARRRLIQLFLHRPSVVQATLNLRHERFWNVNGESTPLVATVQHPARVLLARPTSRAILADTRGSPQGQRAENGRRLVRRALLQPAHHIARGFVRAHRYLLVSV